MGITGLLPFLEKSSTRTNISQFSGSTVVIDSYCWLHKGIYTCGEKLLMGQATDAYVQYCMKFINMLLIHKIKPILVFDGRHLPAKAETELKRKETRQKNRSKAAELIRTGQITEGKNLLKRSINVTHEMALQLIKHCQKLNIDCIVAPYEADAQLAYLNVQGIADIVITEDSDLILFGCKKIFFKMDCVGNGLLVEQDRLHLAMGWRLEDFTIDKFRYVCILSGCDYLPSLPGIGLIKAKKFISRFVNDDIFRVLPRLGSYLNMKSVVVTKDYIEAFVCANVTFKHQLVFCPIKKKQIRLNEPPSTVTENQLYFAGEELDENLALQLAYGNCDPFTFKQLHNFDPDTIKPGEMKTIAKKHTSIWSREFNVKQLSSKVIMESPKINIANVHKSLQSSSSVKENDEPAWTITEIINSYACIRKDNSKTLEEANDNKTQEEDRVETSPILCRKRNPFVKPTTNSPTSPSLLFRHSKHSKSRTKLCFKPTSIDEGLTESRFFTNSIENKIIDIKIPMIDNVDDEACAMDVDNVEDENSTDKSDEFKDSLAIIPNNSTSTTDTSKRSKDSDSDSEYYSLGEQSVEHNYSPHFNGNKISRDNSNLRASPFGSSKNEPRPKVQIKSKRRSSKQQSPLNQNQRILDMFGFQRKTNC